MDGAMPGCPRYYIGVVDVRDVADLHIRAMTHPAAKGERFLAVAGDAMSISDIAKTLKRRMGAAARRVPTWQLPNWLVRFAALRDPAARQIIPELGKIKNATNGKAKRVLGWVPRSRKRNRAFRFPQWKQGRWKLRRGPRCRCRRSCASSI